MKTDSSNIYNSYFTVSESLEHIWKFHDLKFGHNPIDRLGQAGNDSAIHFAKDAETPPIHPNFSERHELLLFDNLILKSV